MFGNLLVSILSIFITFGCARPKYLNNTTNDNSNQSAKETQLDCRISFLNSGLCLSWFWENKPTSAIPGSLIFKTYRLNLFDQTPIEIDTDSLPQLILWMPSMGHGSTPTQVQRFDVGTYRANNVYFIMPGNWQLKFQIKNGTELTDEAQVNILF